MKIYVVKLFKGNEEITVGFSLFFRKAKKIAKKSAGKYYHWLIEEWPIGRQLDPRDRREARDIGIMAGEIHIPPETLSGPYDGKVTFSSVKSFSTNKIFAKKHNFILLTPPD